MPSQPAARPGSGFELSGVSVQRSGRPVLDTVTAVLPGGRITALAGPSGSGKSTLLRLLNRFVEPDRGTVTLDGVALTELDVRALRRRVGLVAQQSVMLTTEVAEEVRVGAPALTEAQVADLLHRVGLPTMALQRDTASLSGGEMQRLALARALAVGPDVLLLDEPTSALDGAAADVVMSVIARLAGSGLTVVLVSHDLPRLAAVADTVVVLDRGRVAEYGSPAESRYLNA